MSNTAEVVYMRDPPPGEDRFASKPAQTTILFVSSIVLAVANLVYALRIYTRVYVVKAGLRTDDYLVGVSVVMGWAYYGLILPSEPESPVAVSLRPGGSHSVVMFQAGVGKDFWQVTVPEYQRLLILTVPCTITYLLASVSAKLSLLFLYRGLSPHKPYKLAVTVLIVLICGYTVAWILVDFFQCRPIAATWDMGLAAHAECIDTQAFYKTASIANVCMDIVILLVPLYIVVPLQIPRRQKLSLILLFATGGFVIIAAVQNIILTGKLFGPQNNYTGLLGTEFAWVTAEISGSVICASGSSLKPFFARYLPALLSSGLRGGGGGAASSSSPRRHHHPPPPALDGSVSKRAARAEAYELDSGDEEEGGKKRHRRHDHHDEGDEEEEEEQARLWTSASRNILISANCNHSSGSGRSSSDHVVGGGGGRKKTTRDGIAVTVTKELEISYKAQHPC
ncbi:hypothetical protein F4780DRAFT_454421 [Xylariomycetidae sp. FL0641]|nr:hypothetical protein F4780DRAFT_454421 [Xylariomycetidae sp. FL0641]